MDSQLTDTLRAVLSDPDAMQSILKIAQGLTEGSHDAAETEKQSDKEPSPSDEKDTRADDVITLNKEKQNALNALLPKAVGNGTRESDSAADNRVRLLMSLRPFLDPSRREKADSLIKALSAAQVLYQLGGSDLFKGFGL